MQNTKQYSQLFTFHYAASQLSFAFANTAFRYILTFSSWINIYSYNLLIMFMFYNIHQNCQLLLAYLVKYIIHAP